MCTCGLALHNNVAQAASHESGSDCCALTVEQLEKEAAKLEEDENIMKASIASSAGIAVSDVSKVIFADPLTDVNRLLVYELNLKVPGWQKKLQDIRFAAYDAKVRALRARIEASNKE